MIELAQIKFYKHYKLRIICMDYMKGCLYQRVETVVKCIDFWLLSTGRKMIFIFPG